MRKTAPRKLTEDLIDELSRLIGEGNYIITACQSVHISDQTYRNWRTRGKDATSGLYKQFYDAMQVAEAKGEVKYVGVIRDAANTGTWQAAAWFLERKYPDRWGRRQFTDITSGGKPIHKLDVSKLTDGELETLEKLFSTDGQPAKFAGNPGGESKT